MTDLYLIAHRVRGEPAFDVATRMECPECAHTMHGPAQLAPCAECDGLGYWWIIPTSGHRAYPYASQKFGDGFHDLNISCDFTDTPMPPDLPDHYTTCAEPKVSLVERLGLHSQPTPAIPRRRF